MAARAPLTDAEKARLAHEVLRAAESGMRSKRQLDFAAKQAPPPGTGEIVGGRGVSALASVAQAIVFSQDATAPGPTDEEKFVESLIAAEIPDIYRVWDEATHANLAEHYPDDLADALLSRERSQKLYEELLAERLETGSFPWDPVFGHGRPWSLANAMYDFGRQGFLAGEIDFDTAVFKLYLIDSADYTVNLGTHQFVSDIPAAAREEVSGALANKTTTAGVADCDDLAPAFTAATGDQCEAVVVAQTSAVGGGADVAVAAQRLVGYIDTATGLPVLPNGGNINFTPDSGANRLFKL